MAAAEGWLLNHPKYAQLSSYPSCARPQLFAALHTYLDLTEVKLWECADISYSEQLQMAFITAQESKEVERKCILPLPANTNLTVERFAEFFVALKHHIPHHHGNQQLSSLTLSLVDSDSTVVYYRLTDGLQPSNCNNEELFQKVTR